MTTLSAIKSVFMESLSKERPLVNSTITSYINKRLDRYQAILDKFIFLKEISTNWISILLNKKTLRKLRDEMLAIKSEIKDLYSSYSKFRRL